MANVLIPAEDEPRAWEAIRDRIHARLRAVRNQDAATYARIQAASCAVMVEAFAVAVVIDPDEPVPYWPGSPDEASA